MAYLLSIDASTNHASVALSNDNQVLALRSCGEQKEHAAFLQPAIAEVCTEAGVKLKELQAIAVTVGPGSYTGLRVSLASAKGLCYALQLPLITTGTLEVMALAAQQHMAEFHPHVNSYLLCPLIDARRQEVFTAIYSNSLKCVKPPFAHILTGDSFIPELNQQPVVFFGTGAAKWKAVCEHSNALFEQVHWHAGTLALLAFEKWKQQDFASLAYSTPMYIKEFHTTVSSKK
mgnify:CR=1 FL=1